MIQNKCFFLTLTPPLLRVQGALGGHESGVILSETIPFRPATALSREGHCHLQLRRAEILRKGFRQAASNVVAPEVEGFVRPNLRQLWNCRGDDSRQVRDCSFSLVGCSL